MPNDCTFCDIVDGLEPAHLVYEDDSTTAFLDINPAAKGHTLVVPNHHVVGITDVSPETTGQVFETARHVATAIDDALDPDGITVVQSTGAAAGQDVFHMHVHVIPRWEDDDIRFAPGRLDATANAEVADLLAEHC